MDFEKYKISFDLKRPVKPKLPANMLDIQALQEYTKAVEIYNKEIELYKDKEKEYYKKRTEILEEFKNDLAIENHVNNLPKEIQDKIFSKAYADGHASGYHDIAWHYEELADFTLDIINFLK
jgi:hypothetical protein